jgi:hypothetical protein
MFFSLNVTYVLLTLLFCFMMTAYNNLDKNNEEAKLLLLFSKLLDTRQYSKLELIL